ncbi:hypothetical protein DFH06DRAFT_1340319 [Mycena polygramma]|nr:hypothetical protein DFH06DRAFT_1340319 [Mycena polygramma]
MSLQPGEHYIGSDLIDARRVITISAFQDAGKGIYPLGKCPPDGKWNSVLPWDKTESFLRQGKSEKPIILWAVGEVTDRYLVGSGDIEPSKINVSFKPLDSRLRPYCVKLMHDLSTPPDSTLSAYWMADSINCSAWTAKRNEEARPFTEIYDATDRFRSKSSMNKLDRQKVDIGDIVLMELYVSRYSNKDKDKRKSGGPWGTYLAVFSFNSISILEKAPLGCFLDRPRSPAYVLSCVNMESQPVRVARKMEQITIKATRSYPVVSALLFPTEGARACMVGVAAKSARQMTFDLATFDVGFWVSSCRDCKPSFVSHFPIDTVLALEHSYSVVFTCCHARAFHTDRNRCIANLFTDSPPAVYGDVLVFKHWRSESLYASYDSIDIISIEDRDLRLVEEIVKWTARRWAENKGHHPYQ